MDLLTVDCLRYEKLWMMLIVDCLCYEKMVDLLVLYVMKNVDRCHGYT